MRNSNSSKKGFTLIELLVVIAIISLLSSIVIVSLESARQKGRDSFRKETLRQFQTALQIYANEHDNTYPNSGWNNFETLNSIFNLVPQYFPTLLVDPYEGEVNSNCAGEYGFWYGSYNNAKSYKIVACSESDTTNDPFGDPNPGRPFGFSRTSDPEIPDVGCSGTNYDPNSPYYINLWPACW